MTSTLLIAAMFIAAAAASTKTEMRPRRSPAPAPVPIPPSPLQEFSMDNYNDEISTDAYNDQDFSTDTYNDAWQDQTMTYDVVLLDSGRSTSSEEERAERGREILLQELEDVSKKMPLPLPLPLRKLLKQEPIVADEDWQNYAAEIQPSKVRDIQTIQTIVNTVGSVVKPPISVGVQLKPQIVKPIKKKKKIKKKIKKKLKKKKKQLLNAVNSLKKKKPLKPLALAKLIKLGAPQVKIFLIPSSGTVISPDGTFIANGAAAAVAAAIPPQPTAAAPNVITLAVPSPAQLSDIGFLGVSGALVVLMIYLIAQSLPNRRQWQLRKSDDGGSGGAFDARHYRMDLRQHHRRFRRAAAVESATEKLFSGFGDLDPAQDCETWLNCSTSMPRSKWEEVLRNSIFASVSSSS